MVKVRKNNLVLISIFVISLLLCALFKINLTIPLLMVFGFLIGKIIITKTEDSSTFIIFFLSCYLPFYAIIRAYLIYANVGFLNSFVNLIRDALIIGGLLIVVVQHKPKKKKKAMIELGIIFLLCNYLFGLSVSMLSGYATLGVKGAHLNIIPIFLVYIVLCSKKINLETVKKYVDFSINVAIIVALIGIYFYIVKPQIFGMLFLTFSQQDITSFNQVLNYSRMVSTFLSPNVFGSYMALSIILVSNKMINIKIKNKSFKNIFSLILFSICLLMSFSRGAWLFAAMGVIVVFIMNESSISVRKVKYIFLLIISSTIAMVLINYAIPDMASHISARLSSVFELDNVSSYGRIFNWLDVINVVKSNVFGLGLGVTGINLVYFPDLSRRLGVEVIDGYYVKLLAETGIVGAILFSIFVIFSLISLIQFIKKSTSDEKFVHILSLAVFVGFLFQSLGSNTFDYVNMSPFLWIHIGLSLKIKNISETVMGS